jgi:hypothetical protein
MPTALSDFSIFDAVELVSYDPAGGAAVANIRAVRRPLTQSAQRNVERYIELEATDVVFHIDAAPLAGVTLAAGDSLVDAGSISHLVLFVERQVLSQSVAVICRPPA